MSRFSLSTLRPLWIACALALPLAGQAAAQPAPPTPTPPPAPSARPAAWVLSFNYGAGNLSMDGDSLNRDFGSQVLLRLGHIVDNRLAAGFQAQSWSASEVDTLRGSSAGTPDLSRNVLVLTMNITMFPTGAGFYARGGVGICRVREEFLAHDPLGGPSVSRTQEDVGFAVTLGGGYEYRYRRSIGLVLDVDYSRFTADHVSGNLFNYTGGVNLYW
jgi:opacity protein-like surface antigen